MVDRTDEMLPIANVGRMMRNTLPARAKISKEAKETMQECATEFISFVTGEASDKCQKENRKTLSGDDICWALSTLGFDNYADVMTRYLHRYRDYEKERAQLNQAISGGGGGWCAETSGSGEARSSYSDQQEFGRGENSRRKGPAAEADRRTSGGSTDPFEFRMLGKR